MSDLASIIQKLIRSRVESMSQTANPGASQKPNILQAPYNPAAQYAPPIDMNGQALFGKGGSLSGKGGGISGGGG